MKTIFTVILVSLSLSFCVAQSNDGNLPAPFYHGVASGDPLPDAVIIWTRAAPLYAMQNSIIGKWRVATDSEMQKIVQEGDFQTDESRDYTVKIDVTGLTSDTYYYYQFETAGKKSLIGRTKTAPKGSQREDLRFAVVSCNNYQGGYFNGFRVLAQRHDLDAVIHLGDYIYEYGEGQYGNKEIQRFLSPTTEIVQLEDYRMRYAQYRLDPDFIKIHQQHPFICIWDDHETANNAHKDGAQNHQPKHEGDWEDRKSAAKQAYFEWLPIRNHPEKKINRTLKYGDMMDLILLDTRLEARNEAPKTMYDEEFMNPDRVILGEKQREWLFNELKNSTATWKIIGQQVIFSELNVGWVNPLNRTVTENIFLDIWDGYPVERTKVIDFLKQSNLENTVFLSGDFHSSFAFEVTDKPTDATTYEPQSGEGAVAVEFVTPSISSANFDEYLSKYKARKIEQYMNKPCWGFPFFHNKNPNPHLKYNDLDRHGYTILNVTPTAVQANFYYVKTKFKITDEHYFETAWRTETGRNHLTEATETPRKEGAKAAPALPTDRPFIISSVQKKGTSMYLQLYTPQPAENSDFCLTLLNGNGEKLRTFPCQFQGRTVYTVHFSTENLQKGNYGLKLERNGKPEAETYFFELK